MIHMLSGLYELHTQRSMIEEYFTISDGNLSSVGFLFYLKGKLEIEGYWEKVGLA
jgi:hypothetical protein